MHTHPRTRGKTNTCTSVVLVECRGQEQSKELATCTALWKASVRIFLLCSEYLPQNFGFFALGYLRLVRWVLCANFSRQGRIGIGVLLPKITWVVRLIRMEVRFLNPAHVARSINKLVEIVYTIWNANSFWFACCNAKI